MNDRSEHVAIIARGNIYLSGKLVETYFKGIASVALIDDVDGILIFPLIHDSAGGQILKMRNLRGDRVVHAQEFFRTKGYAEADEEVECPVRWVTEKAALLIEGVNRL